MKSKDLSIRISMKYFAYFVYASCAFFCMMNALFLFVHQQSETLLPLGLWFVGVSAMFIAMIYGEYKLSKQ